MKLGQLCEALRAGLAFRLKPRGIDATGTRLPELNKRKKREIHLQIALELVMEAEETLCRSL